jgi:hypothetical protein
MPSSDMTRLVSGANGMIDGPTPMIRRSVTLLAQIPLEASLSVHKKSRNVESTHQVEGIEGQRAQMHWVGARIVPSC